MKAALVKYEDFEVFREYFFDSKSFDCIMRHFCFYMLFFGGLL